MANLAFATTQTEYLNLYIQIHGEKPSQSKFVNWEKEVAKQKASLKRQKTMRQNQKKKAQESWMKASNPERIKLMNDVLKYKLTNERSHSAYDALYNEIVKDPATKRLFNYLLGHQMAVKEAKAQGVKVEKVKTPNWFSDGFLRRGFLSAKRGTLLPLDAQIAYLGNTSITF